MTADQAPVQRGLDELRTIIARIRSTSRSFQAGLKAWVQTSREIQRGLRVCADSARSSRKVLARCADAVEKLTGLVQKWRQDGDAVDALAAAWNGRAKDLRAEMDEFVNQRDHVLDAFVTWVGRADAVAARARVAVAVPDAVPEGVAELGQMANKLTTIDAQLAGFLRDTARGTQGRADQVSGSLRSLLGKSTIHRARLRRARERLQTLKRVGLSGHAELARAVETLDDLGVRMSDVRNASKRFEEEANRLQHDVRAVAESVDAMAATAGEARAEFEVATALMADYGTRVLRSSQLCVSEISDWMSELKSLFAGDGVLLQAVDSLIDYSADAAERIGEAVRRGVLQKMAYPVIEVQEVYRPGMQRPETLIYRVMREPETFREALGRRLPPAVFATFDWLRSPASGYGSPGDD